MACDARQDASINPERPQEIGTDSLHLLIDYANATLMLLASHIEAVTPVRSTYIDATYAAVDYLDRMRKVLDCSEVKNVSNQEIEEL